MRIYFLGKKVEKKTFPFGDVYGIELGEEGRGRILSFIPCDNILYDEDTVSIETNSNGRLKIVKSNITTDAELLLVVSAKGSYTRGTSSSIEFTGEHDLIACGLGAYGDAGRLGEFDENLLHIKGDGFLRVKKSGGYKTPATYYHVKDGKLTTIGDKTAFDVYIDMCGVNAPKFRDV